MTLKYNPLLRGGFDESKRILDDLEDVSTAGTTDGLVLTWEQSSGTWKPAAVAAGDMLKSDYVTGQGTVYNASRLEGETLATVQAHGVDAGTITQGTIGLARVPAMDDTHIPNLETLSYGGTFAEGQIPNLPTSKIISGTFNALRIPTLPNLVGTLTDPKIPDVDTLSYSAAFVAGQIPNVAASKITTGTFNANRIPALPTSRITSGTFNSARIPVLPTDRYGSAVLVSGTRSMTGDLDFAKHQAKAMALEALGSAPASPATAQMYYNTSTDKVMIYIA